MALSPDANAVERQQLLSLLNIPDDPSLSISDLRDRTAGGINVRNAAEVGGFSVDELTAKILSRTQATVDGVTSQQNLLMQTAMLKEELSATVLISAWNDPATQQLTGGNVITAFVPPYPCQIIGVALSWEYFNLPTNDTNYWSVSVQKRTGASSSVMAAKNTQVLGEAITARTPWRLDGASWNITNSKLGLGDTMALNMYPTGTPGNMRLPVTVTYRWIPL